MSGFNLRNIQTVDLFNLDIKGPDGEPTGVVFRLASPAHPARKAQQLAKSRKMVTEANRSGKVALPDPEDVQAQHPDDLAALTFGWVGYEDENGPVPFSQAAARALYADPSMLWLTEQVEAGLTDKMLFTQAVQPN